MFEAIRPTFHLILHVLVPFVAAKLLSSTKSLSLNKSLSKANTADTNQQSVKFTNTWQQAFIVMMLTMIVDIDHLLADPIYQAGRCSINFHPLHTPIPIIIYVALCIPKKTRVIGLGLVIHMILDGVDCAMMG